jgi:ATP/ADP translocase
MRCAMTGNYWYHLLTFCASNPGVLFFTLVLGGDAVAPGLATLGLTPLMGAVLVGAAQNVFSKSSKYSLFDPCKEMAYIPLDQETQVCLLSSTTTRHCVA